MPIINKTLAGLNQLSISRGLSATDWFDISYYDIGTGTYNSVKMSPAQLKEYFSKTQGLSDLSGVAAMTLSDEDLLEYSSSSSKWINVTRKTQIVYQTSDTTIQPTVQTQTCFCNNSNTNVVYTLSQSSVNIGKEYTFSKFPVNTGSITVKAQAGTTIADSNSGGTVYNNTTGESYANITLLCLTQYVWIIKSAHGTWTTN